MAKYKKTASIDAVKTFRTVDGCADWFNEDAPWLVDYLKDGRLFRSENEKSFKIQTLEGVVDLKPGNWIARGVNGEIWPIDEDVFAKTYKLVVDKKDNCIVNDMIEFPPDEIIEACAKIAIKEMEECEAVARKHKDVDNIVADCWEMAADTAARIAAKIRIMDEKL